MVDPVVQTTAGRVATGPPPEVDASVGSRAAATALDVVVLAAGFLLTVSVGVSVVAVEAVAWLLVVWLAIVSPLYFACYHAFGHGATPGQRELGVGVRDADTGERIGLGRALVRAYAGVLGTVLVAPLLVDVVAATWSGRGVTLHERLTRTRTVRVRVAGPSPSLALPTTPALRHLFETAAPGERLLRRGARLVAAEPRLVVGAVAAVSAGLLVLVALLALLVLADSPDVGDDALPAFVSWLTLSIAVLASGVYWTQTVVVAAVEAARTGSGASLRAVLARALTRVNALSAALLLLLAAALAAWVALPLLLVGARFALVPPVLVLEGRSVLGAFARSWALTRGRTWRTAGLVLLSLCWLAVVAALTSVAVWLAVAVGSQALDAFGPVSALELGLTTIWCLALVAAPTVAILAALGAAWSLLYEDLRGAAETGS